MYWRHLGHLPIILVLPALVGASPMTAQTLLRFNPPSGQVVRYRVVAETWVVGGDRSVGADASLPTIRTTTLETRTVSTVADDRITYLEVIDSVIAEFPSMPDEASLAMDAGTLLRGAATEVVITPRGRTVSTRAVAGFPRDGIGDVEPRPQGVSAGGPMLLVFPETPVSVGTSWSDSTDLSSPGRVHGSTTRTMFRLERMEGAIAVISLNAVSASETGGAWIMRMTGEVRFDTVSSRLLDYRLEASVSESGPIGEAGMRTRIVAEVVRSPSRP